ncbi:hypothetical protein BOX15_Mlig014114g1 [Macrostomum lignano]|uniref:Uncharacterized protein n=1 Tax=Macrostomum lignano TaxID=282301 RepID=A0A267DTD0_9PLAT|nr:hypothetical protein BOX15_Mlig014114g1 [Macrostomum lignano]
MSDNTVDSTISKLESGIGELQISGEGGGAGPSEETYKETVYFKGKDVPQKRSRQSAQSTPQSAGASASVSQQSGNLVQQAFYRTSTEYQAAQSPALSQSFDSRLESFNIEDLLDGSLSDSSAGATNHVPQSQAPAQAAALPEQSAATAAPGPSASNRNFILSADTRMALLNKLKRTLADEKLNSQLHNAVLQNKPREEFENLLCDLNCRENLVPIINLVNVNGQTPLSLCLKMRRSDLIPLLIDFDAAPAQLCGPASHRTNHFHYAFSKCLDSVPSVQMVCSLISGVSARHQSDLLGLLAKDLNNRAPLDYLNNIIYKLNASRQDAASVELLSHIQGLKSLVCSVMPRLVPGPQNG